MSNLLKRLRTALEPTEFCQAPGCEKPVSQKGHKLCYSHYKQRKSGAPVEKGGGSGTNNRRDTRPPLAKLRQISEAQRFGANAKQTPNSPPTRPKPTRVSDAEMLTASKLGKVLDLPGARVNLLLAELGWVEKTGTGWQVTRQGERQGGRTLTFKQKGTRYAVWPDSLLQNKVFLAEVNEFGKGTYKQTAEATAGPFVVAEKPQVADLRTRFPAKYRAADGHYVRSRAELSIDNWLYMHAIVHAYERKLPVEEDAYCDFYLPQGKVYIEYWGMEEEPTYAQRKKEKQVIYARHGLNLVELADAELENLDDNMARLLLPFGVDCT